MKQKFYQFIISVFLYYVLSTYAKDVLVMPPQIISLSSFLPPILGLMWGPIAAFGVSLGELLSNNFLYHYNEVISTFFAAYLPYKLWHLVLIDKKNYIFAFTTRNLLKFIAIIFVVTLLTSAFVGLTTNEREIFNLQLQNPKEYAELLFLNNFDIILFFGMPIFFILISHGYNFYIPNSTKVQPLKKESDTNRLALVFLYGFFLALFVLLDVSGIIYDLDHIDTWMQFNIEILTMMNITLTALIYMFLKYRYSIMTNVMLLEIATIFIAALVLGSVSFVAINGIIGEHVDNDLQKMSVIYRERLSHTFNDTRMAVNSMSRLALSELDSYERLQNDESYRKNYLDTMERNFISIAENSSGSIGFYMQLSPNIGNAGFLCTRQPQNWGNKLPNFVHQDNNIYKDRYHVPHERYLARLSEPYLNSDTLKYMISYVVPIQKDDKFIGIIGIDIDFDYIIHEIKRMSVYEHGYVCLLDKNGEVLYANQQNINDLINRKGFYETETYLSNGIWLKIAAFAHDIYSGRNNMLIHFTVVMLFVVIVVSFFSIWLAKKGIQPLMLITDAAKKIASGDLDVKLSYKAKNELGILVGSIKEMVSKLEIYVYRDKLTGLLNPTAYARKIEAIKKLEKPKYAVAVFDANFLKKINDNYGHEAGNELIIRAASLISRTFSNSSVFRIGGDEFVAILEGIDYENRDRLLNEFDVESEKEKFKINGHELKVSVARGIAIYNESEKYSEIFKKADAAMYKHKSEIKSRNAENK